MTDQSNIIPILGTLSAHQSEMQSDADAGAAAAAMLETLATEITAANEKAKGASRESLTHYRTVGEKLNEAKIAIGHGDFSTWAESKGFKRERRRRLMSLAKHWHVIEPHLEGDGWEGVGYSVKAACEVIDKHLGRGAASKTDKQQVAADEQEAPAHEMSENSSAERACGNRSATIASSHPPQTESEEPPQPETCEPQTSKFAPFSENVWLWAQLNWANARIDDLEMEVERLKANEAKYFSGGILMEKAAAGAA